jgi:hypothetical protein
METHDQRGDGWAAVLRRQPARIVQGRPEGGYTNAFEVICLDCGDHCDVGYTEVSPELQRICGPYTMRAGLEAHDEHFRWHQRYQVAYRRRTTLRGSSPSLATAGISRSKEERGWTR